MSHLKHTEIFSGIRMMLDDDGVFVFEDPCLGDVMTKTSFDQIYDEHVFYFGSLSFAAC